MCVDGMKGNFSTRHDGRMTLATAPQRYAIVVVSLYERACPLPAERRARRCRRPSAADDARMEFLRDDTASHRHQGRLRGGRLRRVHGRHRGVAGRRVSRGSRSTHASGCCLRSTARRVFTVESRSRSPRGALHPVQQALVECHGIAMRLLHARLRDEPVRPVQERHRDRRALDDRRRAVRAISAAAPATGRSSTRRSAWRAH